MTANSTPNNTLAGSIVSFQRHSFNKERLFYTQGDYGLWQCTTACHAVTYDNEAGVFWQMANEGKHAFYASVGLGAAYCPEALSGKSVCISADLATVLGQWRAL